MAISLENVQTAYTSFLTAKTATATAKAAIVALGAYPALPAIATTDASYNNVLTAQATWTASYNTLEATYQSAIASQRAAELNVISVIQTGSGTTQGANQWYAMTNNNWIGYSSSTVAADGQPYLVIETVQPTTTFFNAVS